MKTTKSLMIALIALLILASNAFAVIRSPYPQRTSPPDTVIVITVDRHDWVRSTLRASK